MADTGKIKEGEGIIKAIIRVMKYIAVYCGSSTGDKTIYSEQAYKLGHTLVLKGFGLVYGGGISGLMGEVARGALDHNGKVIGVMPSVLVDREIAHKRLSELILVDNMHERKFKMNQLSHGFIALPGGFGTMEELFEILSWRQIGLHDKPAGLLNTDGFYDQLLSMMDTMVERGFLQAANRDKLKVDDDINSLMDMMFYH